MVGLCRLRGSRQAHPGTAIASRQRILRSERRLGGIEHGAWPQLLSGTRCGPISGDLLRRSTVIRAGASPFTNRVGLMFLTRLGGYDGTASPFRDGSGPDRHPPSPRCAGGRGRLDSTRSSPTPNHPLILKFGRGFFAT
jgi:hypothetical protein